MRSKPPSADKYELPAILHGHTPCFDLTPGPHAAWAMTAGEFIDVKGNVLNSFKEAAEYHERTKEDVYVWWEALYSEPPGKGWREEKDKYCAVEDCWGRVKKGYYVCCIKCPRAYHLSCIDTSISVDVDTFECEVLGSECTNRIEPILKRT